MQNEDLERRAEGASTCDIFLQGFNIADAGKEDQNADVRFDNRCKQVDYEGAGVLVQLQQKEV